VSGPDLKPVAVAAGEATAFGLQERLHAAFAERAAGAGSAQRRDTARGLPASAA
jgi:hypothetical protein